MSRQCLEKMITAFGKSRFRSPLAPEVLKEFLCQVLKRPNSSPRQSLAPSFAVGLLSPTCSIHELIEKHGVARTEGSYLRLRDRLIKTQCLILDDPGIKKPSASVVQDLCDILKERFSTRSKIITSQIPIENWKEVITDHYFAPKEKITGVEFAALVRQRGFTGRVLFASNGEFDSEKLSGIVDKIVDKQPAEWDVLKS